MSPYSFSGVRSLTIKEITVSLTLSRRNAIFFAQPSHSFAVRSASESAAETSRSPAISCRGIKQTAPRAGKSNPPAFALPLSYSDLLSGVQPTALAHQYPVFPPKNTNAIQIPLCTAIYISSTAVIPLCHTSGCRRLRPQFYFHTPKSNSYVCASLIQPIRSVAVAVSFKRRVGASFGLGEYSKVVH